ncbi:MAG: NAD+ synthase [Turneriella sp.]|nr:NAD+ synthase [Turneriella sp.]
MAPDWFPPWNPDFTAEMLARIVREEVLKTGLKRAVVGVSGGVDSALSLVLSTKALGRENVLAVLLPYKKSQPQSLAHAKLLCEKLGVRHEVVELTAMADAYFAREPELSAVRQGNVLARLRMVVLYDLSAREAALVIGTSNKTELLLGYSTLWGDMASAINPLGDLYKFQVYAVARAVGVIPEILDKPPSADLWPGQTDEAEMGFSYALADRILYHWLERNYSAAMLKAMLRDCGEDEAIADAVLGRVMRNAYKRKMPIIAKVSPVTIGREFRTPRDWGL